MTDYYDHTKKLRQRRLSEKHLTSRSNSKEGTVYLFGSLAEEHYETPWEPTLETFALDPIHLDETASTPKRQEILPPEIPTESGASTNDGHKLSFQWRICPKCHHGNPVNNTQCHQCAHRFGTHPKKHSLLAMGTLFMAASSSFMAGSSFFISLFLPETGFDIAYTVILALWAALLIGCACSIGLCLGILFQGQRSWILPSLGLALNTGLACIMIILIGIFALYSLMISPDEDWADEDHRFVYNVSQQDLLNV